MRDLDRRAIVARWVLATALMLPPGAIAGGPEEESCALSVPTNLPQQELRRSGFQPGCTTPVLVGHLAGPWLAVQWHNARGIRTIWESLSWNGIVEGELLGALFVPPSQAGSGAR